MEFCNELWANIIGGLSAAILFAIIIRIKDCRKHKALKELAKIMGRAIEHRNFGERHKHDDEWIKEAKDIEQKAIEKAKKVSITASASIDWLDRIDPYLEDDETGKYISILSKVIIRIRDLLNRYS